MRPISPSRRLLSTALAAALAVLGLSPVAAHAAGGSNLALGKAATASSALGAQPASTVTDGSKNANGSAGCPAINALAVIAATTPATMA